VTARIAQSALRRHFHMVSRLNTVGRRSCPTCIDRLQQDVGRIRCKEEPIGKFIPLLWARAGSTVLCDLLALAHKNLVCVQVFHNTLIAARTVGGNIRGI
jgi:hypothetical protein